MRALRQLAAFPVGLLVACGVGSAHMDDADLQPGDVSYMTAAPCTVTPSLVAPGGSFVLRAAGLRRSASTIVYVTDPSGTQSRPATASATGELSLSFTAGAQPGSGLVRVKLAGNREREATRCAFAVAAPCGDGSCTGDETCSSCQDDCGVCPGAEPCGDGSCSGDETCTSCQDDCGACPPPSTCSTVGRDAFHGCYYDNADLTGLAFERSDASIDFSWGTASPDPRLGADAFSARWQGDFSFEAAEYEFMATADDGVRLYLDDTLIVDKWVDQSPTSHMATRTLTAGLHRVRMEYYENGGGATAQLVWGKTAAPPTGGGILGASPSPLALDTVHVGQTRTYPVVISNSSGASVTIASVEAVGSGLSHGLALPKTLANGASAWFTVTYEPMAAGGLSGGLYLKSSNGATLLSLPVTATAMALDAANSVSVVAHGARGDGVTDDRAAFQAAASAAGTGKVLYVPQPPGGQHYKLTGFVRIYGSVVGAPGATRPEIRMYGANGVGYSGSGPDRPDPYSIFYYKGNTTGTVITGLHLNGGRDFTPGTNVYGMHEFSHAIMLVNVSNLWIDNNRIENTQGDNILIGGEPGSSPCVNVKIVNNVLAHAMRCAVFPGDTRWLKVYLNTITKVVEYQSAIDFEPNFAPQQDWDAEVAYNDFGTTLQYDHVVITSNTGVRDVPPGGRINVHGNWGAAGRYSVYVNVVYAGTTSNWVDNTIQTSLPLSR